MGIFNLLKEGLNQNKKVVCQELPDEFHKKNSKQISEKRELKKEKFFISGTVYYEENIKKLRVLNPNYKSKSCDNPGRIYKYYFINKPVKLIPEPDNEFDKNAIQVMIAGEIVGYIPKHENLYVKDILENHDIKYISSFISGGEFKLINADGPDFKSSSDISVSVTIGYV